MLFDLYDQQLERLKGIAERVCGVLRRAGIGHRIVGGLAVLFHVEPRDPFAARLTKDVDLAVNRTDLARITEVVRSLGLEHRHTPGLDMLVAPEAPNRGGVHLLFVGEKVRPTDLSAVPAFLNPRRQSREFSLRQFPIWCA
jgi:hypothetical protein